MPCVASHFCIPVSGELHSDSMAGSGTQHATDPAVISAAANKSVSRYISKEV